MDCSFIQRDCIGLHLNLVPAFPPSNGNVTDDLSEEEIKGLENFEKYQKTGLGYYQIQMTKPQSLGYALNDSPVGLAGWIVEKFHSWTNDDLDRMVINDDEEFWRLCLCIGLPSQLLPQ